MVQIQAIHINPVTIKKDKMDNELKNILQKAKKATALWFISYIVEFLRITGIVSGGRTDVMLVAIFARFAALVLFAVCIYELLVYKNIIK